LVQFLVGCLFAVITHQEYYVLLEETIEYRDCRKMLL